LTRATQPSGIQPSAQDNPSGSQALRAGALSELFEGFSQQALFSGLFVDEFRATVGFSESFPEDPRDLSVAQAGNYPFQMLSAGRINAIIATASVEKYTPRPAWHIGELFALIAATEIMFSENLCSGVPVATVTGNTPSYGLPLTRSQLLRRALVDLDSATQYVAGSDSIAAVVAVLRGRALLDSGDYSAAAAAVQAVPSAFVYVAEMDSVNQANAMYEYIVQYQALSVSDREGLVGLPFVSASDPRVPTVVVSSSGAEIIADANIVSPTVDLVLASGVEAQLIEAEAALASGNATRWSTILNSLRGHAVTPAIPPLSADSTTAASPALQVAVMFRERAFWLFATGHRHGDLRRLVRQYRQPVLSVFPNGPYEGGPETYGNSVVYPVGGEEPNSSYHGCFDTSA
jgi:hypothetical protein